MTPLSIEALLGRAVAGGASDLYLVAGERPRVRKLGEVVPLADVPPLASSDVSDALRAIAPSEETLLVQDGGELTFAYSDPGGTRFRVSASCERRGLALAIRVLASRPPRANELGLPRELFRPLYSPGGLLLFAGPAGSGKSTTLFAVLAELCDRRLVQVVTVEDPIEHRLEPKLAWLEQREVGRHAPSLALGLRDALDASPDAVAVGEVGDKETIALALEAAQTGILVFSTIVARDSAHAIRKLVDTFDPDERPAVRASLARALRMVTSQILARRSDETGRVPAVEIVHGGLGLAALVREAKEREIGTLTEQNRIRGMRTLDDALVALARAGLIRREEAAALALQREVVTRRLQAGETSARFRPLRP